MKKILTAITLALLAFSFTVGASAIGIQGPVKNQQEQDEYTIDFSVNSDCVPSGTIDESSYTPETGAALSLMSFTVRLNNNNTRKLILKCDEKRYVIADSEMNPEKDRVFQSKKENDFLQQNSWPLDSAKPCKLTVSKNQMSINGKPLFFTTSGAQNTHFVIEISDVQSLLQTGQRIDDNGDPAIDKGSEDNENAIVNDDSIGVVNPAEDAFDNNSVADADEDADTIGSTVNPKAGKKAKLSLPWLLLIAENALLVAVLVWFTLNKSRARSQSSDRQAQSKNENLQKRVDKSGTKTRTVTPNERDQDGRQTRSSSSRDRQTAQQSGLNYYSSSDSATALKPDILRVEESVPIVDSYEEKQAAAPVAQQNPAVPSVAETIDKFYTGELSPEASSLRIEAVTITNSSDLNYSSDEKPVFVLANDMSREPFVLVNGTDLCLSFFRFNTKANNFNAFADIKGLKNCFMLMQDNAEVAPDAQPIKALMPAKVEKQGETYILTEKGRIDLGG